MFCHHFLLKHELKKQVHALLDITACNKDDNKDNNMLKVHLASTSQPHSNTVSSSQEHVFVYTLFLNQQVK